MATQLNEFPPNKAGAQQLYPWETWLDGSIWRLEAGTDFACKPKSLRHLIYRVARERNKRVRCHLGDDFVVLQAY